MSLAVIGATFSVLFCRMMPFAMADCHMKWRNWQIRHRDGNSQCNHQFVDPTTTLSAVNNIGVAKKYDRSIIVSA